MKSVFSKLLVTTILTTAVFTSWSQLNINPNGTITPEQAVQDVLIGAGINAFNITFNGSAINAQTVQNSVSEFNSGASAFPINSGVIMQTQGAPTVNNDADLSALAGQAVTNGVIIEFDFIPAGDTLAFNYIFASSEYTSYTCSSFNDVFGFFISGPGIAGPYTNGAVNIATVPGTTVPVAINTVNSGTNPDVGGYCASADPNWQSNAIYFTTSYNPIFNATTGVANFNGGTIVLTANSDLVCSQVYHIKLAVANAVDQSLDSGVFLEANSFTSDAIQIAVATVSGDTSVYEGCVGADFVFIRPESQIADTMIVDYTIGGTATEGTDYNNLPNPVVFLPGEDTVTINVTAFGDGFSDNNETIVITATTINQCGDTIISVGTLYVLDSIPIVIDELDTTVFCFNDSVQVYAAASGIFGPFTYSWTGGQVGDTAYFPSPPGPSPGSIDYYVTATNSCGYSATDTVTISLDTLVLFIDETDTSIYCPDDSVLVYAFAGGGVSPYSYVWSNFAPDADSAYVDGTTVGAQDYYVTALDQCGYTVSDTITVTLIAPFIDIDETDTIVFCRQDSIPIYASASGGTGPYTYLWENGDTIIPRYVPADVNDTTDYYITVTDACGFENTDTLTVIVYQTLAIDSATSIPSHSCPPYSGEVHAYVTGITDVLNPPFFHWSDSIVSVINYEEFDTVWTNLSPGWYYFTVTDDVCSANDSAYVDPTDGPFAAISASVVSGCSPLAVTFTNNSQNANYYDWDLGDGNIITVSNTGSQSFTYTEGAIVTLTAYEDADCFSQTAIAISITICGCMDPNAINYNPNAVISDDSCIYPVPTVNAPNVFTPNSDFENNYFFLKTTNTVMLELVILNRWGNEMFSAKTDLLTNILGEELIGWDGNTKRGAPSNEGVYFYKYIATGIDGTTIEGHGFLQLVRN